MTGPLSFRYDTIRKIIGFFDDEYVRDYPSIVGVRICKQYAIEESERYY